MKIEIKNRWDGNVLWSGDAASLKDGLHIALKSGANLYRANLSGAKNAELVIAKTRILPEGDIIGWKKCKNNILAKLSIPKDAKRSHAFGRKCRAEYVVVLEVIGADKGITDTHGPTTIYRQGEIVKCNKWDNNWMVECSGGIHFFITRLEAENYN